jgi:Arc/MetJ-type ribon-helix-helix transcriptional regulator
MSTAKIAITIDENLLLELDSLISEKQFNNRSQAIQLAVKDKVDKIRKRRFYNECDKLDPIFEKNLADEGLKLDLEQWTEY